MDTFWLIHKITVDFFLFAIFIINISNLISLKKIENEKSIQKYPKVSIMIPVRDEKHNIKSCLKSILAQKYPNFEVILLYDDEDFESKEILNNLKTEHGKIRIIEGKPLPEDWIGKHWACHQMAQIADGDLLLFTDADTRHHPDLLGNTVSRLQSDNIDLLTLIPKEEVKSLGEKIIVPIITWCIHTFYPIGIAQKLKKPGLSITIGQFMLFRSKSYHKIGGHMAVKNHIVDDIMLGRKLISEGCKWRIFDGSNQITCRMYRNFKGSFEGFSRGFAPNFGYNYIALFFVWLWLLIVFLEPIIVLIYHYFFSAVSDLTFYLAIYEIGIALIIWAIVYIRFKFPFYMIFLYPVTIFISWIISLNSIFVNVRGKVKWKGRKIPKRRK